MTVIRALISCQCGLGLTCGPSVISGLSFLFVLALLPQFFSGFSSFPPSTKKNNTCKFQFDLETVDKEPLGGMCHHKFLLIISFLFYDAGS